ncbi:MAG: hypothetical protein WC701_05025 [Kiritimatiellales bacterium]|jgi:hypothetical protein
MSNIEPQKPEVSIPPEFNIADSVFCGFAAARPGGGPDAAPRRGAGE